jgi:hypothetical protein
MESESSLPCSQQPANGPFSESRESSSHLILSLRCMLMLSFHLHVVLLRGSFFPRFSFNISYALLLSHIRATWPAYLILLQLLILIFFSEVDTVSLLVIRFSPASLAQTLTSAPCPHTPSKFLLPYTNWVIPVRNQLTPLRWALLEEPPVVQLPKNFLNMLWNQKVHYQVHKNLPQVIFLRFILILSRFMCVTIDGVWIGEWIYLPLIHTTRNYK